MLKRLRDTEEGFTLIELLVVVIIIGILAAIAIPTFLSQRDRGYQAELTSGVRNYALEIEAQATSNGGTYPAAADVVAVPAGLDADGQITFAYTLLGATTGFTLEGTSTRIQAGDNSHCYNSTLGGLQPFGAACS